MARGDGCSIIYRHQARTVSWGHFSLKLEWMCEPFLWRDSTTHLSVGLQAFSAPGQPLVSPWSYKGSARKASNASPVAPASVTSLCVLLSTALSHPAHITPHITLLLTFVPLTVPECNTHPPAGAQGQATPPAWGGAARPWCLQLCQHP